jgi:hypothetical protein
MGCGIGAFAGTIAGGGYDGALANEHCTDRHLTALLRFLGLLKRKAHEVRPTHSSCSPIIPSQAGVSPAI